MNQNILKALQHSQSFYDNWQYETGYTPITTFWSDFEIAERFGVKAIKDTYKRAFNEWKDNVQYITELTMVLNLKIWLYNEFDMSYAELYNDLWEKIDQYCMKHLKDDDLKYFLRTTN